MKFFLKLSSVFILICLGWTGIHLFTFSTTQDHEKELHQKNFNSDYKIYSLNSPKKMVFCGEDVPLSLLDVKEKLDRELLVNTYWQSQTMLFLKRSNRYFPIIEQILKSQNVPEDFKYLALIESGLEHVVSPAGATGFWQIMKSTGKQYGLEINDDIDERYHLEKATYAACAYLKEAHAKFGSWTLAAASYNMGINGLDKQLTKQDVNNYYDLLLNTETGRYLYRILAVKQIIENPKMYGFTYLNEHLYAPLSTRDTIIKTSIEDLAVFAKEKGINYKILKTLNPWMRSNQLPASTKAYTIQLPKSDKSGLFPVDTAGYHPDSLQNE